MLQGCGTIILQLRRRASTMPQNQISWQRWKSWQQKKTNLCKFARRRTAQCQTKNGSPLGENCTCIYAHQAAAKGKRLGDCSATGIQGVRAA